MDALSLVGIRVCKALDLTGLAAKETMQIGSDLVALPFAERVALRAARLEEVGALLVVTWKNMSAGR